MPEMLLINPRRRAKRRTAKRRKNPSAAQRANWARFARMARAKSGGSRKRRAGKRRSNPISTSVRRVMRRTRSRRRNPISLSGSGLFNLRSYMQSIKDAAIMGAGAVAMDVAFGYVNRYLPAQVQVVPGTVGVGDAVKALLTVAIGKLLSKPTRGLSSKAAMGSLVVQMRDVTMKVLPAGMVPVNGLGYVTAGRVVPQINARANANMTARMATGNGGAIAGYVQGGSPLLAGSRVGAYAPGSSPLLSRTPAQRR